MVKQSHKASKEFYDRADAIISLANAQLSDEKRSNFSASTLYAAARFNAFISAANYPSGEEMAKDLAEIADYFVKQYKMMLESNLEDFAANFFKDIK